MSKTGLQIILVPSGLKMEMHRTFGYGRTTINRALSGTADTSIARRIRAYALANGGVEAAERTEKKWRKVDGKTWVQDTSADAQ
ncbi:MAG: hypothetical protein J6K01_08110 [Paludibacteraceae bacterium]|nr:hypothetical protein [Paludibacteraceae bacterium]